MEASIELNKEQSILVPANDANMQIMEKGPDDIEMTNEEE